MSKWKENKANAVFINTEPTMTDQSQAESTDINIIIHQFLRTGHAPAGKQPIYGDFSELPDDLRGFIEMGRGMTSLVNQLPEQLRDIPVEQLLTMTNDEIVAKLQPPDAPSDKPKDEQQ